MHRQTFYKKSALSVDVLERDWKAFEVNRSKPLVCYQAVPLLTCFAYVFLYPKGGILYHALGGTLDEEVFQNINKHMEENKVDKSTVQIIIAGSDLLHPTSQAILEAGKKDIIKAGYSNNFEIVDQAQWYSVNTYGEHGFPRPKPVFDVKPASEEIDLSLDSKPKRKPGDPTCIVS